MPTDNNQFDDLSRLPGSLARFAVSSAPALAGGFIGFRNLRTNSPIDAGAILGLSPAGQLGRATGRRAGRGISSGLERQTQAAQDVINDLLKPDIWDRWLQEADQRNAVMQSLLETMNDPSTGLGKSAEVLSYKQALERAVTGSTADDEVKELISKLVSTINETGSPVARRRFAQRLDEFRKLGPVLEPPAFDLQSGQPFHVLDYAGLSAGERKAIDPWLKGGGGRQGLWNIIPQNQTRLVRMQHGDGTWGGIYAQVFGPGGAGKGKWYTNVPLQLPDDPGGLSRVRVGENFNTGYIARSKYVDIEQAYRMMKSGATPQQVISSGMPIQDLYIHTLNQGQLERTSRGVVLSNAADVRQMQAALMEQDVRISRVGAGAPLALREHARHLQGQLQMKANAAVFMNANRLRPEQLRETVRWLSAAATGSNPFLHWNVADPLQVNWETGHSLTAGLTRGSFLEQLGAIEPVTAQQLPLGARARQWMGRPSIFMDPRTLGEAVPYTTTGMRLGGLGGAAAPGLGSKTTGMLSAVSVTGPAELLPGITEGQVWSNIRPWIQNPLTKPVLEPVTHAGFSSNIVNRLANLGKGQFLTLSRAEAEKAQFYLGLGTQGPQFLPRMPSIQSYTIGIEDVWDVSGRKQIQLTGSYTTRGGQGVKLFGPTVKATTRPFGSPSAYTQAITRAGAVGALGRLGVGSEHVIVGTPDMVVRASESLRQQVAGAYRLFTGGDISGLARQARAQAGMFGLPTGVVEHQLPAYVAAALQGAKTAGMHPEDIGLMFGNLHLALKGAKDSIGQYGMTSKQLRQAIRTAFPSTAQDIISTVRKGVTVAGVYASVGEGVGDYGRARGSITQRFFEGLWQRLSNMGYSTGEISDVQAQILRKSRNYKTMMQIGPDLLKSVRSVTDTFAGQDLFSGAKKYSVSEFLALMPERGGGRELLDLLAEHEQGIFIDLAADPTSTHGAAMKAAAQQRFGRHAGIYLPGGQAAQAIKGATLRVSEGENLYLGSSYERLVKNLADDLTTLSTTRNLSEAGTMAADKFKTFQREAVNLFGQTYGALTKGKIPGSGYWLVQGVSMAQGAVGVSESLRTRYAQTVKWAGRNTAFLNAQGFMTQMKDQMMGGLSRKEAVTRAMAFFTGLEGEMLPESAGVYAGGRFPMLSEGSTVLTRLFRDPQELESGADKAFQWLMTKGRGHHVAASMGVEVGSFKDIAKLGDRGRAFFENMVSFIERWTGEGEGIITFPTWQAEIPGIPKFDINIAARSFWDADGDRFLSIPIYGKIAKKLNKMLSSGTAGKGMLEFDALSIANAVTFAKGTKLRGGTPGLESQIMNIVTGDVAKGKTTVRFDRLRAAALNAMDIDPRMATDMNSFLHVLEEFITLKNIKLPEYKPIAQMFQTAAEEAFTSGNIDSFRNLVQEHVIPASDALWAGGVTIPGGTLGTGEELWSVGKHTTELNSVFEFMQKAVTRSITGTEGEAFRTAGQVVQGLLNNPMETVQHLLAGNSWRSGVYRGSATSVEANLADMGNIYNRVRSAATKAGSRLWGPVALGLLGSAAVAGVVSRPYSPEPMVVQGESTNPALRAALAAGDVLRPKDQDVPPENFQRIPEQYGMNRPLEPPTTYMTKPTSYQIRGHIPDIAPTTHLPAYLHNITGGTGRMSVTINDTRRPITSNYLDQLMGEY